MAVIVMFGVIYWRKGFCNFRVGIGFGVGVGIRARVRRRGVCCVVVLVFIRGIYERYFEAWFFGESWLFCGVSYVFGEFWGVVFSGLMFSFYFEFFVLTYFFIRFCREGGYE